MYDSLQEMDLGVSDSVSSDSTQRVLLVKGGSSPFLNRLTLRVSFQSAAGFPVFPHLSSLGKYSCLPAPAYLVCSVVLLPAVLSCTFLAKYLGHALKGKLLERQLPQMRHEHMKSRTVICTLVPEEQLYVLI